MKDADSSSGSRSSVWRSTTALAKRLRSRYLDQQRIRDRLPLVHAVERGEVREDLDIDAVVDSLIAPFHYRVLVTGQPASRRFTDNLVRHVLDQIGIRRT